MKNKNLKTLLAKMQEQNQEQSSFENLTLSVSDKLKGGASVAVDTNYASCNASNCNAVACKKTI
jgi:hypothetical protein